MQRGFLININIHNAKVLNKLQLYIKLYKSTFFFKKAPFESKTLLDKDDWWSEGREEQQLVQKLDFAAFIIPYLPKQGKHLGAFIWFPWNVFASKFSCEFFQNFAHNSAVLIYKSANDKSIHEIYGNSFKELHIIVQ